jgi:hypothetical protein
MAKPTKLIPHQFIEIVYTQAISKGITVINTTYAEGSRYYNSDFMLERGRRTQSSKKENGIMYIEYFFTITILIDP